ncbi:FAD-dependent oxidoreductase [Haladaptatus sp. DYF46]|uniref:NAD(P)/FAD-dependent oxidoreductase n=1 Tax=Haladaptatus sp. DYF46 TaxID=2886041 RepID=UPI001E3E2BD7|nr:FAD-dependent oxidoreductase [Haladaptatus sp. DYF46]
MSTTIAVLGSGYAGVAAVQSLEDELEETDADIVWVSETNHHLVLHEVHRCIRKPAVRDKVVIPIDDLKSEDTEFVHGTVNGLDVDDHVVHLEAEDSIDYDYCIVCLGSQTAFYGIDGLAEHALTLKSLGDAMTIHQEVMSAATDATEDDPAQVVIGGAGLTGIQTAGEVAALRDERDVPIEIRLIEMEDEIFPGHDHEFQGAIRNELERKDIDIMTGATVSEVDDTTIQFEGEDPLQYDAFVWAGGVQGDDALSDVDIDTEHNRAYANSTFKTSDDRVLAIGDAALVEQDAEGGPLSEQDAWEAIVHPDTDDVPPPTAEAAMEEGEHVGENVARMIAGREPAHWSYINKGTLVSVGDRAVAHDVIGIPLNTFGGPGARVLKKAISARWIGESYSWLAAARAWNDM